MSLLLDALRKSEAQRRAGELPALDLGAAVGVPVERPGAARHRQAGWMLVVVVLVIGSLAIGWWRPWDPWPQPVQNEAPVRHGRATSASVEPTPPVVEMTRPPQAAGAKAPEATVAASSPASSSSVRAASPAAPGSPPEQPAPAQPTPTEPRPAAPDTDSRPEPKPEPTAERTLETLAAVDPAPATEAAPPQATPPQARVNDLSLDGVIRPWELPESLRAEFPELRVSVHFYAARPADRFVLINGERRVEGSPLGGGVTLEEIRKRGVIVEFKRYRILIE